MAGGDDEIGGEVNEIELTGSLVNQLERSRTTSAQVLRNKVYRLLGALGVDVAHLVEDARTSFEKDLRLRAKRSSRRKQLLQLRIEKAEVPPEKLVAALHALQRAPKNIAAHKRALHQVMSRPGVWPTDPTPERRRQGPDAAQEIIVIPAAGPVRATLAHQFKWGVDQVADMLTLQEYEAAERFHWAYFARMGQPKIGSYGDAGDARDPARRLPLTPTQERAGREWDMWRRRVPPGLRVILNNFVLGLPPRGAEKPLSRAEFGKLYARCRHDQQARGVSDGALKAACGVLAAIWGEYEDWMMQQRGRIKAASENEKIRALIARGALTEAAREIQAETRALEAAAARGVAPNMALNWLQAQEARGPDPRKRVEDKRGSR